MNTQEIRRAFLEFQKTKRDHAIIPRAKVIPENDPTTLFTSSGMQQLLPYLLGEKHPKGKRLADSQTCIRAQDIEDVGDNRHTTYFEMLGNWSLGDYFKKEQLPAVFEFLIDIVGLDPKRLYVTCYIGNEELGIPKDTEAAAIWKDLFASKGIEAKEVELGSDEHGATVGMQEGRIFYYDGGENWWSRGGSEAETPIGDPCGPDSEMVYEFPQVEHDKTKYGEFCQPACDCGRYLEIGNSVFMTYRRTKIGFEQLDHPNVDFGGGLERIAAAAIDNPDVYKISLLWPLVEAVEKISGKRYDDNKESMRVIADHLRAATFMAVDGVVPSNKEQGYVMRRLIRRAIVKAFDLGIEGNFFEGVVPAVASMYEKDFPEIAANREQVIAILLKEEKVFRQTLRKGLGLLQQMGEAGLTGQEIFTLYDTYGFPLELSTEEATRRGLKLSKDWRAEFDTRMQEQRERSKTAAKGVFKGGLEGQEEIHKKYHTATHLLYESLRRTLGDHVIQHGSNITADRLRFDFSHPDKVTPEQLKAVEDMVNEQIDNDLTVTFEEHPKEHALKELKPLGHFGDRYGDVIKIYRMQGKDAKEPFSFEICGGPHVDHTLQLFEDGKKFKIIKEEASSAGIRRIKAVLQ